MESMFEDVCLLASSMTCQPTENRHSCIDICTRIVLSAWTARLRVTETQIIQEACRMSIGDITNERNVAELLDNSWKQPWHPRNFSRLVMGKSALESIDLEIYRSMDALGIYSKAEILELWEVEAWRSLQQAVQKLKARVDNILQAYMQAVSVRESIISNKQAQQVGYLTSLATVFIPISFVAAIFSMGGDFAAGASHFWVYWSIAVPVLAVGCLLLFTNLGRRTLRNVSAEDFPV
jgi:CorA-like Mg2+ transporter protein